jgi:asparagine synthase (glutamine-hydrolysing)
VRVPLLDREVIATAARLDWRSCLELETTTGKLPLRRALARHVEHQTRAKRGFAIPMAEWLRGPLREVFRDRVISRRELLGLPLDHGAAERLLAEHLGGHDLSRSLWTLLSLALWQDRHYQPAVPSHEGDIINIAEIGAFK